MNLALAILLHVVAALDSRIIPMVNPEAIAFVGPAESGPMKSIYVLDNRTLTAYALQGTTPPRQAILPEDVTAFDVADTDGDHQAEVIAVAGKRILRIPVSGSPAEAATLFESDGILSRDKGEPYLYPLVYSVSDRPIIGLPKEDRVLLHSLSGEDAGEFPLRSLEGNSRWTRFGAGTSDLDGTIQWNIWQWAALAPELPRDARHAGVTPHSTPTQAIFAQPTREREPREWPWFPVGKTPGERVKVHFAWSGDLRQETIIFVENFADNVSEDSQPDGETFRYPGVLISSFDPLDFNGDGYDDILLARVPEPGGSLGSLVRTVTNGSWPFELTAHLYVPEKRRFEPRPAALLEYRVEVTTILNRQTFKAIVLRDFNGDGSTDLAVAPNEKEFLVWIWGDTGFNKKADYSSELPEEFKRVEFEGVLGKKGNWGVGLRTEHNLIVTFYSGN
ncbi:MAG: hypothetical protein RBU21_00430 [FCB group bacterium]|jgi:hypothetical protein|nr:hypothetical protein [FCB group bacterium]